MKVIVLGAGLVGKPMAMDLAGDTGFEVGLADISATALSKIDPKFSITTHKKDLSKKKEVLSLIKNYDIVVNAVPGFMGYQTLKTIIEAGKDAVDIAFFPENPFDLDDLAKEKGITAVMDCGVAPGMSNILIGHAHHQLEKTHNALIYVGGLPLVREWPYEYKAVFSPVDVIEEYTRPARYIENGHMVIRPALSDPEYLDFPGVGTLEAFNSDGLRTLAETIDAPNMKEKTLRYPGHIEKMAVLRETGFFSKEEIEINGVKIRPLDFTAKLLFPKWQLKEGEMDMTVMKVIIEGLKDGKNLRYTYDLVDTLDRGTGVHSMARTTGYTATMVVRLIAAGLYKHKGLSAPELIGKDKKCVDFILEGLAKRNVHYMETISEY